MFAVKHFLASHYGKVEFKIIVVCGKFGGDDGEIKVMEIMFRLTAYSPLLSLPNDTIILI